MHAAVVFSEKRSVPPEMVSPGPLEQSTSIGRSGSAGGHVGAEDLDLGDAGRREVGEPEAVGVEDLGLLQNRDRDRRGLKWIEPDDAVVADLAHLPSVAEVDADQQRIGGELSRWHGDLQPV